MAGPSLLIRKRVLVVLITFALLMAALLFRVAWIQLVKGDWYQKQAFEQQNQNRVISAKRGTIFDRNNKELAISASVETISANPQIIKLSEKDTEDIALKLAEILGVDKESVLKKITKESRYELIQRKVDKEIGDKVRKWQQSEKIEGIYVDEDTKRFYPFRNLASHIIGFTGIDSQGLYGIEKVMDQYLKGKPGQILSEVDAAGHEVPFNEEKHIDAQDGLNVILTIDETIQHFAEKAIESAMIENKVLNGATAIVMDPRNGEILAMVSKPDFDLNDPWAAPIGIDAATWNGHSNEGTKKLNETVWRNKAISDTYEPGSTFKAITSAAGLEEKAITPDSRVNDFPVKLGGWEIGCWRANVHGEETFREGVYNSCNPVFVRVAQTLGVDKFYSYVRAFGFYEKTGIALPGEVKGIIHAKPTEVDMATASFGQRLTITPIQLVTAYSAIANGGKLLKPQIIKQLTDSQGNVVKKYEPDVIRTVISEETDNTLKDILQGVVTYGTGKNAYVKGYRVAGKTGTSETTQKDRYIASFCSFAPADNPVICVLVVLDCPTGPFGHMGGVIAAPVAGKLLEETLNYLEVERKYSDRDKEQIQQETIVPDIRNLSIENAKKQLAQYELEYRIEGQATSGSIVVEQTPKPDVNIPKKSVVILYTKKPGNEASVLMPDLKNKTVYEATQTLYSRGLNIKISGIGTSVSQSVAAGTVVTKGEMITVNFRQLENME